MKAVSIASLAVFIAVILILQIGMAITASGFYSFGRSVTMNFAFHIGDNKSDDTITYTDKYISSHAGDVVLAMVGGSAFGTRYTELTDDYLLEMRQPLDKNRFLLTFTRGDNQTIADKINTGSIISKTFGGLTKQPTSFPLYLRLAYSNVDIINRIRWVPGSREIIIMNQGKNERGQHKISIGVIE